MPVFDDQKTDNDTLKGLEESFNGPDAADSGSAKLAKDKEKKDLEDAYDAPDAAESGSDKLAKAEQKAGDDTLGKGFTGGGQGGGSPLQNFVSKLKGSRKFKQRMMIAGALLGSGSIGGVLLFFVMLPLKVEAIVTTLEARAAGAAVSAVRDEVEKDFENYLVRSVIPSMTLRGCHSTIDPSCLINSEGKGLFGKLYAGWDQTRLMNRMANLPNGDAIIIAKKGGTYYMNINGHDLDLTQVIARKQSVFDAPGTSKATKAEIRAAFHRAYANATAWQKVQKHFSVVPYLKDIGVGHCVVSCDFHEKYLDPIETKRIAAKLFIVQKVLTPFSLSYGVLIQCMIAPDQCDTKLQVGTNREESDLNRKLEAELTEYIAEHGVEKLSKLAEKAADINKLGLSGYMTKLIAEKVAETLGGDSAKLATGTALDKVVPIAGQVELALSIITAEDAIPQIDKTVAYTARSMAALQLAEMFTTVVSEMHSGHMDLTELGSFADQFSNIPKDANGNGCDATSSPFYNAVSGSVGGSSSAFGSLFGSSAFAEGTFSNNVTAGVCKCANGQPVPKGKLVCAEENFADPGIFLQAINMFLDNAESISAVGFHVPSYLPGADAYNTAVSPALAAVLGVEKLAKIIIGAGSELAVAGCGKIPACNSALQYFGSTFAEFAGWVVKAIVPNPFAALTGGMNVDMVGAGFDVKYNRYSQDVLGAAKVDEKTALEIQNQQLADDKYAFDSQPLYARMFSTASQYSLISRLAIAMPGSITGAVGGNLVGLLSNPFSHFGSALASMFVSNHAFAANESLQNDPFGITQYAYTQTDLDAIGNSQDFWDKNCVDGPLATFSDATNTVTFSPDWLSHQTQDPDTMQAVTNTVNPCGLIHVGVISSGGLSNTQLLPASALNPDPDPETPTSTAP